MKNVTTCLQTQTYYAVLALKGNYVINKSTQDQQGKVAFKERNPLRTSNKNHWQGAQADPKQKQDRAQDRARTG
jgi:hypothetical protein